MALLQMYREPRVLPFPAGALTGLAAPAQPRTISSFARVPVGLDVEIGVPVGIFGIEIKRVIVDSTDVDSLGQRWYTGRINSNSFTWRSEKLERFLGYKSETSAEANAH